MRLSDAGVQIRERSVLEIADLSLLVVTQFAPGLFLTLWTATALPAWILCLGLKYYGSWSWGAVWALALVLASLAEGVFTLAAGRALFDRDLKTRALWPALREGAPTYLGALFASFLLLVLGSLVVVGGLIVWIRTAYLREAIWLEGARARQAFARSAEFVRQQSGEGIEMLVVKLCGTLVSVCVVEALGLAVAVFVLQIHDWKLNVLEQGGSPYALLGVYVAVPFVSTFRFLKYIDSRTRHDGWDVQVRFQRLAHEEATRLA